MLASAGVPELRREKSRLHHAGREIPGIPLHSSPMGFRAASTYKAPSAGLSACVRALFHYGFGQTSPRTCPGRVALMHTCAPLVRDDRRSTDTDRLPYVAENVPAN